MPPARERATQGLAERIRHEIRQGDLNRALALAERGWAHWRERRDSPVHWEFRLLRALILAYQGKGREVLELLQEEPPPAAPFARHRARRLMCLGRARFLLADYPASRQLLDQALEAARPLAEPGLVAEVQLWRGSTLARCGEFDAAEAAYLDALEAARRAGDAYLQAAAHGNRGFARINSSRYDEAIPFFEEALRLAQAAGARRFYANTLGNLGRCHAGLGDYERAATLLSEATRLLGQLGDLVAQQVWLGNLGEVRHLQHDHAAAAACYREALAISRRLDTAYFTLMWLNRLAELALDRGALEEAESWNREALALAPRVPTRDAGIWARLWSARILALRGRRAEAEQGYRDVLSSAAPAEEPDVVWNAHAGLAALYGAGGRWAEAERHFQEASRLLEHRRDALRREEWRLTFQARARRLYEEYVDFLMSSGQTERALEVAEMSRARVLLAKLGIGPGGVRPDAVAFRRLAGRLRAVLLSYWIAPKRSFAWVVQAGRISSFTLPREAEIRRMAEAIRAAAEGLRDLLEGAQAPRQLYRAVVSPLRPALPARARVIVVPDGPLHAINLETLVAGEEPPRYWIEDVTLCVTPSLALLARAGGPRVPRGRSLLLIGDPAPASERFPRLPAVAREIRSIERALPRDAVRLLQGDEASPDAYRASAPGRFSLIHFAAHAEASAENPLDSAVILARAGQQWKLYARQVMQEPLRARLVTLSACRGAGSRIYAGEGLVGFAWAFLQAGASNVIASLWDVHDESTAELMGRLYAGLAAGMSPAESLRAAKLGLITGRSAWSKPYYWAPFQLYARAEPF